MDIPHDHLDRKIKSVHEPHGARVTIAVLVNCERKPQYFPNLDVAAASTWGKKGKVLDGDGHYSDDDLSPTLAAKKTLSRGFGGPNLAVEAIFKGWTAHRQCGGQIRLCWKGMLPLLASSTPAQWSALVNTGLT